MDEDGRVLTPEEILYRVNIFITKLLIIALIFLLCYVSLEQKVTVLCDNDTYVLFQVCKYNNIYILQAVHSVNQTHDQMHTSMDMKVCLDNVIY